MVIAALFSSCDDSPSIERLHFIGDSLVAKWDVQASFPFLITDNDGLSGAHIDYIIENAGRYADKDAVVLIGTNDMGSLIGKDLDEYCTTYINAVLQLRAKRVYLFSVPPRNTGNHIQKMNATIVKFNAEIKQRIASIPTITYIDIYDALSRDGTLNPEYSFDGLHFNVYGYEILTKALTEKL